MNDVFFYLRNHTRFFHPKDLVKISRHAPNFQKYVAKNIYKKGFFVKYLYDDEPYYPPSTLTEYSIGEPNFLTNDVLMFLTEDKIVLGYNTHKDI